MPKSRAAENLSSCFSFHPNFIFLAIFELPSF
jgi:hypothetical protein